MMKKGIVLLLVIFLFIFMSALADTAVQPGPDDLSKVKAIQIASEKFLNITGYEKNVMSDFAVAADLWEGYSTEILKEPRRWQVVIAYAENPAVAFVAEIESPSGDILSAVPEDFTSQLESYKHEKAEKDAAILQGRSWIAEKGPWETWSYQDKAAFYCLYGRNPNGAKIGNAIGLPGVGDIPLAQALIKAKEAIIEHFGETVQRLDALVTDCIFFPEWPDDNQQSVSMWIIAFRDTVKEEDSVLHMLYQANVLAQTGDVDRIIQFDEQSVNGNEPSSREWPPYTENEESSISDDGDVYYNPRGGKYYHEDPNCPSVSEKFLPMTKINKSDLNKKPYQVLLPCPYCKKTSQN